MGCFKQQLGGKRGKGKRKRRRKATSSERERKTRGGYELISLEGFYAKIRGRKEGKEARQRIRIRPSKGGISKKKEGKGGR